MKRLCTILTCLILNFAASGQDSLGYEQKFLRARQLEESGSRARAKEATEALLKQNPADNDARVFYARLCAYDGDYRKAITELEQVLQADPKNLDAYVAITSVHAWANEPWQALALCDAGLAHYPQSVDLLLNKCRVLEQTGRFTEALAVANTALLAEPGNADAIVLKQRLKERLLRNQVSLYYYYTHFAQPGTTPWHNSSIEYQRLVKSTPLILRVNQASRFNLNAFQIEADAYPRFGKKNYAYLNAGYSPEVQLFPVFRAGAEVYRNLSHGFEASLGARLLNFNSTNTWLFTGYAGKYYKSLWFGYRPFVNVQPGNVYLSHVATLRVYGADADNYATLTLSNGNIPFLIAWSQDLQRASSNRAGIDIQHKFKGFFLLKAGLSFEYEEYYPGLFRNRFNGWIGLVKRF